MKLPARSVIGGQRYRVQVRTTCSHDQRNASHFFGERRSTFLSLGDPTSVPNDFTYFMLIIDSKAFRTPLCNFGANQRPRTQPIPHCTPIREEIFEASYVKINPKLFLQRTGSEE